MLTKHELLIYNIIHLLDHLLTILLFKRYMYMQQLALSTGKFYFFFFFKKLFLVYFFRNHSIA